MKGASCLNKTYSSIPRSRTCAAPAEQAHAELEEQRLRSHAKRKRAGAALPHPAAQEPKAGRDGNLPLNSVFFLMAWGFYSSLPLLTMLFTGTWGCNNTNCIGTYQESEEEIMPTTVASSLRPSDTQGKSPKRQKSNPLDSAPASSRPFGMWCSPFILQHT
jgi:hypothetical protein